MPSKFPEAISSIGRGTNVGYCVSKAVRICADLNSIARKEMVRSL
jgi:hypothetical protein